MDGQEDQRQMSNASTFSGHLSLASVWQQRQKQKIEMALDQCESMRFPFKKKLWLHDLE
jgi:hypothetical protein